MRGHILGLPKLLGIAVVVMLAVFLAWTFASPSLPGEAIPDSTAAMVRGGACGKEVVVSCKDATKVDPDCKIRDLIRSC
jgi:hypothetical protein